MNDMTFTNFVDDHIQRSEDPSPIKVLRKHQSFRDVKSRERSRKFLLPRTNSPFPDLKPNNSVQICSSRYDDLLDGHSRERSSSAVRESSPLMKLSKVSSEVGTPASKGMPYRLNDQQNFFKTSARRDLLQALDEQDDIKIQLPRLLDLAHNERLRNDIRNFEHNETKKTSWLHNNTKHVRQKKMSVPSADISRSRQFSAGINVNKRIMGTRHASEDKIRETKKKMQEFREVFSPRKREPKKSTHRQSDKSCLVTFNKDSEASFSVEAKEQSSFLSFVQQQARKTVSQESPKKKPLFDCKEEEKITRNSIFHTRKTASNKEKKKTNIITSPESTIPADVRDNKTPNFGENRKEFRLFLQNLAGDDNNRRSMRKSSKRGNDKADSPGSSGRAIPIPKIPQCFQIRPSSRRKLSLKKNESACMDIDYSFSSFNISEHHNRSAISLKSQKTFLNRIMAVDEPTKQNFKENNTSMQQLLTSKTRSEKSVLVESLHKGHARHSQQNSTFALHSRDYNHHQ